jgi:small-conductance mechanosensitive channel
LGRLHDSRGGSLCDDPTRYLDPRWRRDLLSALEDVLPLLFERIRMGQSQEAIAERVLAREIEARSPYNNAARREQGRAYGARMIDNAVDIFNTTHESIMHAEESIQTLSGDLAAGRTRLPPGGSLTANELRAFVARLGEAKDRLQPVRDEIEALKRYHAQP